MPKGMADPVLSILKEYERDPAKNDKKAVLLTPQGGYFLYGNRFCSIQDYDLEFHSHFCQMCGQTVRDTIFLGLLQDGFHAVGEQLYTPDLVNLIFHIDIGDGELLRGILLAVGQETRFALFCDTAVEELYRLSRNTGTFPVHHVRPDESLEQYAEGLRRNDLHGLAELYLQGRPLKSAAVVSR